ncbi:peptidylprolyl isomerase [uncultured Arthrobacter sp.]|mgnify:CR=1 FL=1|uniref:peptidylprolyl isomerase n=1 Tax=uncultured Arthrobacter sp. TaxID=114050 RepID=UPI003217C0D8
MAASSRSAREAKRRVQQMEAKRELRKEQDKRRKRDNVLAIGAGTTALVVALVLQLTVFASNPTEDEYAAAQAGLTTPSAPPPPPTPSASPTSNAENIPKPETAAGQTFTGELKLNSGTLGVELDGTAAPQAAAVFKSLADQNFYAGVNCHRLTTAETFGVLQCGSKAGDGSSDPSFTWGPLENTPQDNSYPAGTIAVARSGGNAYGNGTQFFIVYKDTVIPADAAGGYTVVGKVTSGLDVVSNIAAAGLKPGDSATDGAPAEPVTIDSFSLK